MNSPKQPSDTGITGGIKIVSYVADDQGKQELVSGAMWQPVDIVNRQAWQEIEKQIESSKTKVAAGRASCLHYYMTANQMDTNLLASYTRQSRWLVRLHMIPFFFSRLCAETLNKYGEIFQVSLNDLVEGKLRPPVYKQRRCEAQAVD